MISLNGKKSRNTYYIFRHGQTFASKRGIDYGETQFTAEITREGLPAVERLALYLKNVEVDENYTSELLRCVQTTEIVSRLSGKRFEKLPLLNEFLEPTFEEFKTRMLELVHRLERGHVKVYSLCTHGGVVSALKHFLTRGEYEIENLMDYPETGKLMIIKNGTVDVLDFNTP